MNDAMGWRTMRDVGNAVWKAWPHVGECYRVRTRGERSAFSREGFLWTDSYGNAVPRPANKIRFHGGPNNGCVVCPHEIEREIDMSVS